MKNQFSYWRRRLRLERRTMVLETTVLPITPSTHMVLLKGLEPLEKLSLNQPRLPIPPQKHINEGFQCIHIPRDLDSTDIIALGLARIYCLDSIGGRPESWTPLLGVTVHCTTDVLAAQNEIYATSKSRTI